MDFVHPLTILNIHILSLQHIPKMDNYFDKLFPKIAALALKLPDYVKKVCKPIIRHRSHVDEDVTVLLSILSGHPNAPKWTSCIHHSVTSPDILPARQRFFLHVPPPQHHLSSGGVPQLPQH